METGLRTHWVAVAGASGAAASALDGILSRYREPHRRYHSVRHLARVTADIVTLGSERSADELRAVLAAGYFHDAVYDPRSASNEADSAALASRVLAELGWSAPPIDEVARLVLATRTHEVTDDASAILLDADLAVLGADPAAYADYVRGVRGEYGFVDDDDWRTGRAAVLRSFLDREVIFHTPTGRLREPRARANLTAELATLVPAQ